MKKILIISASFYPKYEQMLLDGATKYLEANEQDYEIIKVPGCFEISPALAMAKNSKQYSGYITLGCVIKGQTSHYDYVCAECARGINSLATNHALAVGFGIITCQNEEQANERADINQKDLGGKAAKACLTMIEIRDKMSIINDK